MSLPSLASITFVSGSILVTTCLGLSGKTRKQFNKYWIIPTVAQAALTGLTCLSMYGTGFAPVALASLFMGARITTYLNFRDADDKLKDAKKADNLNTLIKANQSFHKAEILNNVSLLVNSFILSAGAISAFSAMPIIFPFTVIRLLQFGILANELDTLIQNKKT